MKLYFGVIIFIFTLKTCTISNTNAADTYKKKRLSKIVSDEIPINRAIISERPTHMIRRVTYCNIVFFLRDIYIYIYSPRTNYCTRVVKMPEILQKIIMQKINPLTERVRESVVVFYANRLIILCIYCAVLRG